MYFIGIDPSTSSTGFAVVDKDCQLIRYGKITGAADNPEMFAKLYKELLALFEAFPPTHTVCENQFIGANRETGIKTVRPTGVVLAVAGLFETSFEFAYPAHWRKVYQGKSSDKRTTFAYVNNQFPGVLGSFNKDNDIADAIGIACCAAIKYQELDSHVSV